jgi:hypothetical protein
MEFKEALVKSLPAVERIAEWGFKDRSRYEWKREPPVGEIERILSDWREKLQAFQHVREELERKKLVHSAAPELMLKMCIDQLAALAGRGKD